MNIYTASEKTYLLSKIADAGINWYRTRDERETDIIRSEFGRCSYREGMRQSFDYRIHDQSFFLVFSHSSKTSGWEKTRKEKKL
jgi:hypothetical protein